MGSEDMTYMMYNAFTLDSKEIRPGSKQKRIELFKAQNK